jgi:hypothetical protein
MKKLIFSFLFFYTALLASAQTDSLEQYTGKYKFPEGSPVTEIGVVLENGTLTATSVLGNSELKKTDAKDVFEIVAYAGTATFRRNGDGKVVGLRIQVQDVDMEGTRETSWAIAHFRNIQLNQVQ